MPEYRVSKHANKASTVSSIWATFCARPFSFDAAAISPSLPRFHVPARHRASVLHLLLCINSFEMENNTNQSDYYAERRINNNKQPSGSNVTSSFQFIVRCVWVYAASYELANIPMLGHTFTSLNEHTPPSRVNVVTPIARGQSRGGCTVRHIVNVCIGVRVPRPLFGHFISVCVHVQRPTTTHAHRLCWW